MSQEIPLYLKMLIKNFVEEISKNPQIKAMLDEIRTKLIEMKDGRPTSMQGFVDIEMNVIESDTKTVLDYIHPQDREEDDFELCYVTDSFPENVVRLYTEEENQVVGSEKIGLLIKLERMGIIDGEMREKIIYALMEMVEPNCDLDEFYFIVATAIRDSSDFEKALLLTKMLEDYSLSIQH